MYQLGMHQRLTAALVLCDGVCGAVSSLLVSCLLVSCRASSGVIWGVFGRHLVSGRVVCVPRVALAYDIAY